MTDLIDHDALKPRRAHLCAFDGCGTICIEMFCWKHRAVAKGATVAPLGWICASTDTAEDMH